MLRSGRTERPDSELVAIVRRVEIVFPVLDRGLRSQIREILEIQLADAVKARRILPGGRSVRIGVGGAPALRAQERLYEATGARAVVG